jgi:hypothetical protein
MVATVDGVGTDEAEDSDALAAYLFSRGDMSINFRSWHIHSQTPSPLFYD